MDINDEKIILSKRAKIAGLTAVCCLFLLTVFICLRKEADTYDYTFDLEKLELKEASFTDGYLMAEASSDDYSFATRPFVLPVGDYVLELTYSADVPSTVVVQGNNNCVFDIGLPETGGEIQSVTDTRLVLPNGTDCGRLKLYLEEEGQVFIYSIIIHSPAQIYRDYYFIIAVAFIISVVLSIIILRFNDFGLSRERLIYLAVFAAAVLLVNLPFLRMGLLYDIDTQAHLKRIEAIAQGLRDGQLPVVVGPNYANQYGELVVLNPNLFLYIPALLRLLNVSLPTAYNFFMILVNLATAVSALVCAERLFGSIRWGLVASVIYLAEPFRLYIMLRLGAGAGMGVAMAFLPFVVAGIYEVLYNGGSRWKYLAVGLWGIACSHVLSLMMAIIFVIVYTLFNIKKLREKRVITSIIKAALLFFVLSAGTLAPFLGYYFKGFNRAALEWTDFYHFPVDPARELMNLSVLVLLVISWVGLKKAGRFFGFLKHFTIIGIIVVLMATPLFPWALFGKIPFIDSFLSMVQYPFRFHLMAAPFVSIVTAAFVCSVLDGSRGYAYDDSRSGVLDGSGESALDGNRECTFSRQRQQEKEDNRYKPALSEVRHSLSREKTLVVSAACLLLFGIVLNFYLHHRSEVLFGDPVSGEINTVMEDYLPEGTLTEWYDTDTGDFSNYDTIQAYSYEKNYTAVDLTYTCSSEGEYMEFPLFYYEGYTAYDQDGRALKTEKGEKNRVRVYLTKSDEVQELHVRFEVKKLYTALFIFSLVAGTLWFAWNIGYFAFRALSSGRIIQVRRKL